MKSKWQTINEVIEIVHIKFTNIVLHVNVLGRKRFLYYKHYYALTVNLHWLINDDQCVLGHIINQINEYLIRNNSFYHCG